MRLIIDIPELFYNNSKKRVSSGIDLPIDKYVANGMPYEERPQGDLISREALKTEFLRKVGDDFADIIDNAPTVLHDNYSMGYQDGVRKVLSERPQGEWKYRKEWFEDEPEERMAWGCSSCGFSIQNSHDKQNYCPYCGAQMMGNKEAALLDEFSQAFSSCNECGNPEADQ